MIEKYTAKKIYNGYVSVRSPVIEYCIKNKRDLLIVYKSESMLVNHLNLNKFISDNVWYVAKRSDKYMKKGVSYFLYDYPWIPKSISKKPPTVTISMTVDGAEMMLKALRESLQTKI